MSSTGDKWITERVSAGTLISSLWLPHFVEHRVTQRAAGQEVQGTRRIPAHADTVLVITFLMKAVNHPIHQLHVYGVSGKPGPTPNPHPGLATGHQETLALPQKGGASYFPAQGARTKSMGLLGLPCLRHPILFLLRMSHNLQ